MLSSLGRRGHRAFERWAFESTYLSGSGLGLFRIVFAGGLLLLTTPGHGSFLTFTSIAALPDSQFSPPFGPMMLLTGFPAEGTIRALEIVVAVGLVAVAAGYRTRASSVVVAMTLLFLWGVKYSGGKIDHASVLIIILLLMMSFTPWDRSLSLDALRRRGGRGDEAAEVAKSPAPYQWVGAFLAFMLGLAYLAAGLPKMLGGWLDPSSHAVRNLIDLYAFRNDNPGFLAEPLTRINNGVFWEAFDYVATTWEVGFIVAIFWLRSLRWALATAAIFHMMNALALGIVYYPVLWFYALFLDWDAVLATRPVARLRTLGERIPPVVSEWYVAVPGILVTALALHTFGSPILAFANWSLPERISVGFVMLTVATAVGVSYLAVSIPASARQWSGQTATASKERVSVR